MLEEEAARQGEDGAFDCLRRLRSCERLVPHQGSLTLVVPDIRSQAVLCDECQAELWYILNVGSVDDHLV